MNDKNDEFRGEVKAILEGIKEDIKEIKTSQDRIENKANENAKAIAGFTGASRALYVAAGIIAAIVAAAIQAIAAFIKR